jgi:putative oxidoreductase
MDFGLLLLRVVIGALFIGHGTQKLFGWFDGDGPEGTGRFMSSLGYRGTSSAILAGLGETIGGALLLLGLLTPLGAAALFGVMVNAIGAVHAQRGAWNQNGGYEYPLVIIAAMVMFGFAGPGALSMDNVINLDFSGLLWGFVTVCLGMMAGLLVLFSREPEAAEQGEAESQEQGARRAA